MSLHEIHPWWVIQPIYLESTVLDEVDVWLPDVAVMVESVQGWVPEKKSMKWTFYLSPVSIVMDQARVNPLLLDDELDLVVQAWLVRGGEGEEGHADVDLRGGGWRMRE